MRSRNLLNEYNNTPFPSLPFLPISFLLLEIFYWVHNVLSPFINFLFVTSFRRNIDYLEVLDRLKEKGIAIRVASPKLVMEEAPESYKDVTDVVDTCK